jgi:drug/metabolite transporter (DMT)-like permease
MPKKSDTSLWILLALVSHATWGSYSVFARYLQNHHRLGALSIAALANALASWRSLIEKTLTLKACRPKKLSSTQP